MPETRKSYQQLQITFSIFFTVGFIAFVVLTFFNLKQILHGGNANPVFERYAIMITLIGIPSSLKIYHYLIKKVSDQHPTKKIGFYNKVFATRLAILEFVLTCNVIGLYYTGLKNFFFMIFITLLAFLFCLPNKTEFETLCDNKIPSE